MQNQPAVLYVEDDAESRRIMKLLLEEIMGLSHVTILADCSDFMSTVQQLSPQPDIVLLDIHMSPCDGFQLLQCLREEAQYAIPIIALTASVMNEEVHTLRTAGFDGVIAKPIDVDIFPNLISRILHGEKIWNIMS